MHEKRFEVLALGSDGRSVRHLPLEHVVNGVHVVEVRARGQQEHPRAGEQPLDKFTNCREIALAMVYSYYYACY